MLMFEHPACDNVVVDIHLSLPEPASPIDATAATLAARVRPACPICKEPMLYRAWGFSATHQQDEVAPVYASMLQPKSDHQPLFTRNKGVAEIIGCTCGWRLPPGTTDSDTALSTHIARARVTAGALQ